MGYRYSSLLEIPAKNAPVTQPSYGQVLPSLKAGILCVATSFVAHRVLPCKSTLYSMRITLNRCRQVPKISAFSYLLPVFRLAEYDNKLKAEKEGIQNKSSKWALARHCILELFMQSLIVCRHSRNIWMRIAAWKLCLICSTLEDTNACFGRITFSIRITPSGSPLSVNSNSTSYYKTINNPSGSNR